MKKMEALQRTHQALDDLLLLIKMTNPDKLRSDPGCKEALTVLRNNRDNFNLPITAAFSEKYLPLKYLDFSFLKFNFQPAWEPYFDELLEILEGAYTKDGIEDWFFRPRIQLENRQPFKILLDCATPSDSEALKVKDLARALNN